MQRDECVGSFSEDPPLGWDPVAAGNRAGDGMACNGSDRRQWRKQEAAVGAAASRIQGSSKSYSIRWVPQPVMVSEEKASDATERYKLKQKHRRGKIHSGAVSC